MVNGGLPGRVCWCSSNLFTFQVFDVSRVAMLIPEINLLAHVFCIDPSAENSMLMGMVRWKIVSHDTPTGCHHRMNESTSLI